MASEAVDNWQERCEKSDRMDIRIGQADNGLGRLGTCHYIRENSVPSGWSEVGLDDFLDGLIGGG